MDKTAECPICKGQGVSYYFNDKPCPRCMGSGRVKGVPCATCGENISLDEQSVPFFDKKEKVYKIRHADCPPPENYQETVLFLWDLLKRIEDAKELPEGIHRLTVTRLAQKRHLYITESDIERLYE